MPATLPTLAALQSNDDGPLARELRLVRLRSDAAVVRTLADCVEDLSRSADADELADQLIEEMTRLGSHLLDAAAAFAEAPRVEESGVFAR